jgi:hypothetical protein
MPDHRAYTMSTDGHVIAAEILRDHPDDAAAVKAAEQIVDGHDVEVWDRARVVFRLKAKLKLEPQQAPK